MTSENYPEGYISVELQKPEYRKARRHLGGSWRAPVHGTWVYAADDGTPLAHVRTLGILMPKKMRRYSLHVEGVVFERIAPLVSRTRPIKSGLAPYDTPKAALAAGTELIRLLRS